jgi:uncharacterized membrane protein
MNTPTENPAMDKRLFASSALSAALGLVLAMQGLPAAAQGMKDMPPIVKENMEKMAKEKLEKCYGINAVAKNDCAEGVHSCAGQATQARDAKSFVMVPAGVCAKIAGGKLKAA